MSDPFLSTPIPDVDSGEAFNDADWFSLLQSLKAGNVIPIVGPDALQVEYLDQSGDRHVGPFYRLVASDLLKTFQLEPAADLLEQTWVLHKAVNAILAQKGAGLEQRIRREISRLIAFQSEQVQPAESLRQLANIGVFNWFVSLTPDNLLERAMEGGNGSAGLRWNSFSPREASESIAELNLLRPGERGVFQLLGSFTNVAGGFAIHEEDTLEYLYQLQSTAARRFAGVLSELRRRDKFLIGCNFPDWFGRAMLRLLNDNRFSAKDTVDFLLPQVDDAGLRAFLSRFSPTTLGFEQPPGFFIEKLAETFTGSTQKSFRPGQLKANAPTVFVSYASEDAEAARLTADQLLSLGFSDVWLDKKKLIGGDDWSNRIEDAIEKCDFFMPLLSAQADRRREGVFWEEWRLAVARARRIRDAFLLPVGIDNEVANKTRYLRIGGGDTKIFFEKQILHAPSGVFGPDDRQALTERCRRFAETFHG
ncbi:toll/interleukin-1 receptor domain-containing protein [Methylomonas sp. MgM2]